MLNIDAIDQQLIRLLRKDGRMPVATLAKKIGVTRVTIQNRLNRLEKRRIITGYTALISSAADNQVATVRALTSLELDGDSFNRVNDLLLSEPSITAIHATNGRWDMIIEIQTQTLEDFNDILSRIRNMPGIKASESNLLLSTNRLGSTQI
jgi:DNA-binding Lrp family transcriptional regulator